jgi:hypothetical protein
MPDARGYAPERLDWSPMEAARHLWWRLGARLGLTLVALGAGGCCVGPGFLTLHIDGNTPRWDETMDVSPQPQLTAHYGDDEQPAGPIFEIYDSAAQPVTLSVQVIPWAENPEQDGSCPHTEEETTVAAPLPPGDYTLVHRRANGTGRELACTGDCPSTTFDGEKALVVTLRVSGP